MALIKICGITSATMGGPRAGAAFGTPALASPVIGTHDAAKVERWGPGTHFATVCSPPHEPLAPLAPPTGKSGHPPSAAPADTNEQHKHSQLRPAAVAGPGVQTPDRSFGLRRVLARIRLLCDSGSAIASALSFDIAYRYSPTCRRHKPDRAQLSPPHSTHRLPPGHVYLDSLSAPHNASFNSPAGQQCQSART